MSKPIAVLVSDVHYSLKNLELSDKAFRAAIDKAAELGVPLIDCGDLTDDKAIIRAEVANQLIEAMHYARHCGVKVFCLVGNHSLINQKGKEHALNFLTPYCFVVDTPGTRQGFNFIPYQASSDDFMAALKSFPKGSIVLAHQGTAGGFLGDYVKDDCAFDPKLTRDWRIFLGHYHRHYELENTVSIGNPFTMSYGEASDGPKGFLILNDDGSYTREISGFRKHIVIEADISAELNFPKARGCYYGSLVAGDMIWIKVFGAASELAKISKVCVADKLFHGALNFKLDLIPTESDAVSEDVVADKSEQEILDGLIDNLTESSDYKKELKQLWRDLI